MDKDTDQRWFDLLGNKTPNDAETVSEKTAASLRKVIKGHDEKINYSSKSVDQGLEKLKFRLRKEGLSSRFSTFSINFEFAKLAVAASLFLALGMILESNLQHINQDVFLESDVVKGETVQVVDNFEEYLNILESDLNANHADYSVVFNSSDEVELKIALSPALLKLLDSRRIEIDPSDRIIIFKIQRSKK